ncbi:MAG: DUF3592 domain-containing protein [Marinobacter sp.]|nr:DUF3592 domain-containing protein [Marinobacter sp.]
MKKFILTLVSLGGFVLAGWLIQGTYTDIRSAHKVTGVITGADRKPDAHRRSPLYPTVRYQSADGQTFEQQLFRVARTNTFRDTGKPIAVLYQPADPEQAKINEFRTLWGVPFSLLLISSGCVILAWSRRRKPWIISGLVSLLLGFASFYY